MTFGSIVPTVPTNTVAVSTTYSSMFYMFMLISCFVFFMIFLFSFTIIFEKTMKNHNVEIMSLPAAMAIALTRDKSAIGGTIVPIAAMS